MIENYSAWGKLMLFGEYLVLRGTQSMALSLSVGQHLEILPFSEDGLHWQCFQGEVCWLEIQFSNHLDILSTNDPQKAEKIQTLLKWMKSKKPSLKLDKRLFLFRLDFNRAFGFGTSSSLVALLSQWSGIDAYQILAHSFGGSGYDVAAALQQKPTLYSMQERMIKTFSLPAGITENILFVYLGEKQDSANEVRAFKEKSVAPAVCTKMNGIIQQALHAENITEWEDLMRTSERLLSKVLGVPPVKEKRFPNYPYAIKSLGAWGGDFVMATFRSEIMARQFFETLGYKVMFNYEELVGK